MVKKQINKNLLATLGDNIKMRRDMLGLTQEALGDKCGLHSTRISELERGRFHPRLDTIALISDALSISAWRLLYSGPNPEMVLLGDSTNV